MNDTRIVNVDYNSPDQNIIAQAASVLKSGGLLVAPTETRYGLLARADESKALDRLYKVKQRPANMPCAIFVDSINSLKRYANLSRPGEGLADRYLPGPLTLVAQAKSSLGAPIVVDKKLGIRYSPAPVICSLLVIVDFPITATSANLSQQGECFEIDEIYRSLGDGVDLYLNCGRLEKEVSTVVDISVEPPLVLREGAISSKDIYDFVKQVENEK